MIPIGDSHKPQTFPLINYCIIAANIIVFMFQLASPDPEAFIRAFSFIPDRFAPLNPSSYFPVFTSMWLHGGILHIGSNMLFLHVFGDNVEDRVGHIRYIVLYTLAGGAAVLAQYILTTDSQIPLLGASGAISGVAGMYFVFFKHARIKALIPSFVGLLHVIELSAPFFLGYWFFIQIASGIGSLESLGSEQGGVAFFAHIGGFVFGYLSAKLLRDRKYDTVEI